MPPDAPPELTPEQLRAAAEELGFSVRAMASALGISVRMLTEYRAGRWPVPRNVALAVDGLLARHRGTQSLPPHQNAEQRREALEEKYGWLCRHLGEVPDGWLDIAERALARIAEATPPEMRNPDRIGFKMKSKYGELRSSPFQDDGPERLWKLMREIEDAAEEESRRTCEVCGAPGEPHTRGGWIATLCQPHLLAWERRGK